MTDPKNPFEGANPFAAPGADDEFVTTPQAAPERVVPTGGLDDEISITPQAAPERVAPPETTPPPE